MNDEQEPIQLPPLTVLQPVARARHPKNQQSIDALSRTFPEFDLVQCVGMSEVARARNRCASLAYPIVERKGGLVMWFDSDMTISSLDSAVLHAAAAQSTGFAITGRALQRHNPGRIASSLLEQPDGRKPGALEWEAFGLRGELELTPVLMGLACVMMPAQLFLEHCDEAPQQKRHRLVSEGPPVEYLVCCPKIVKHKLRGHVFVSEDHDYTNRILGGGWLAQVRLEGRSWDYLDYGHVVETVAMHPPRAHTEAT